MLKRTLNDTALWASVESEMQDAPPIEMGEIVTLECAEAHGLRLSVRRCNTTEPAPKRFSLRRKALTESQLNPTKFRVISDEPGTAWEFRASFQPVAEAEPAHEIRAIGRQNVGLEPELGDDEEPRHVQEPLSVGRRSKREREEEECDIEECETSAKRSVASSTSAWRPELPAGLLELTATHGALQQQTKLDTSIAEMRKDGEYWFVARQLSQLVRELGIKQDDATLHTVLRGHPTTKPSPIPWATNSTTTTLVSAPVAVTLDTAETEAIFMAFALIPMLHAVYSQGGYMGSLLPRLDLIIRFIQLRCAGGGVPVAPIHAQTACIVLSSLFGTFAASAKTKPKFEEIFRYDNAAVAFPALLSRMWQIMRTTGANLRAFIGDPTSFATAQPYLVGIGMAMYRLLTIVRASHVEAPFFNTKQAVDTVLNTVTTLTGQSLMPTGLPPTFFRTNETTKRSEHSGNRWKERTKDGKSEQEEDETTKTTASSRGYRQRYRKRTVPQHKDH